MPPGLMRQGTVLSLQQQQAAQQAQAQADKENTAASAAASAAAPALVHVDKPRVAAVRRRGSQGSLLVTPLGQGMGMGQGAKLPLAMHAHGFASLASLPAAAPADR